MNLDQLQDQKQPVANLANRLHLSDRHWLLIGISVSFFLFLITLQTTINGSLSPYATDVGEIQNALPRWGTIHWTGYPQYTAIGSLVVTVLQVIGIAPAAGASLVSAFWATIAVALLILLACELGASMPIAVAGSLIIALSTAFWMDASIAEVHSMTMTLMLASLWFALRFGRAGQRRDLLWLAFVFSQGFVHQRAVIFMAPAILILIAPHLRLIKHHLLAVIAISLIAPLTYLYLPLRVHTGADWVFGDVGNFNGLWALITDNRVDERLAQVPHSLSDWLARFELLLQSLADDLPWPLLALGLGSLPLLTWAHSRREARLFQSPNWQLETAPTKARSRPASTENPEFAQANFALVLPRFQSPISNGDFGKALRREAVGLTLSWLPYVGLSMVIGIGGGISDALLAAKLPILLIAGIGCAMLLERLSHFAFESKFKIAFVIAVVFGLIAIGITNYPKIVSVTRDDSAQNVIATAVQVAPPPDAQARPTALLSLWGNDYWSLAYAQTFESRLPGLQLINHNEGLKRLLDDGTRLWALSNIFYWRPVAEWEQRLDTPLALSSVAPGIVQISPQAQTTNTKIVPDPLLDLQNGIHIVDATLSRCSADTLLLTINWQAIEPPDVDYSVAVHLLAVDPPTGPQDILAQADQQNPVEGWYRTSHWNTDEIVIDKYRIEIPRDSHPVSVRIGMYRQREHGSFDNTPWLSLPLEP